MTYKTVLVHLDEGSRSATRVAVALALAAQHEAHLIGAAMTGVSRFLYQDTSHDDSDPNLALHLGFLRERAGRALQVFDAQVGGGTLRSSDRRVVDDEAGGGISLLARYADLVVIGQVDGGHPSPSVMSDFPAYVVVNSGRPVWIVPYSAEPLSQDGQVPVVQGNLASNILISWNASREASRAVLAAMPLLQRARQVTIAIFDVEDNRVAHGERPGEELAAYLARHGVQASIALRQTAKQGPFRRSGNIGEGLLALASDLECDLLVMGAYGHSRLRETIMGGVTRTILESMTVPVLMMH